MTSIDEIARSHSPDAAALILLLRVQLGTTSTIDAARALDGMVVSPEGLLQRMAAHGIRVSALPEFLLGQLLGQEQLSSLKASDRKAAAWNLRLLEAQRLLDECLLTAGLPYMYAKGLLLGWSFHGDLTTRPTRDIDVMVHRTDVPSFRRLLKAGGYEELYYFPEAHQRYGLWLNREAVFRKRYPDGAEVHVELQWSPVLSFYRIPVDERMLFSGGLRLSVARHEWPVPSEEAHLLVLLLHHGVTDGWRSLHHVLDLYWFLCRLSAGFDWPRLRSMLQEMGILNSASAGLMLCQSLLGVRIPTGFSVEEGVRHRLEASLLARHTLTRNQRSWAFLRRHWLLADGMAGRARLCVGQVQKALSPGLIELEGIPLPHVLFPLYYILKLLRPLLRPLLPPGAGAGAHEKPSVRSTEGRL